MPKYRKFQLKLLKTIPKTDFEDGQKRENYRSHCGLGFCLFSAYLKFRTLATY